MHRTATQVLSVVLVLLGLAMILTAVSRGGGPLATGVVLGILFAAAGAIRLWASRLD